MHRGFMRSVLLIVIAACGGGSDGSAVDAPRGDAPADAPGASGRKIGRVLITQSTIGGAGTFTSELAGFLDQPAIRITRAGWRTTASESISASESRTAPSRASCVITTTHTGS